MGPAATLNVRQPRGQRVALEVLHHKQAVPTCVPTSQSVQLCAWSMRIGGEPATGREWHGETQS
jgi:hypothetical protein